MHHCGRTAARLATVGLVVAALASPVLGMGGFGGGDRSGMPARDFHATFTDADGNHTDADRVTAGGDASLEGDLGRGRLRVPFDNITSVAFQPAEADRVRATVKLREGDPVTLLVRSSTTFYGQVPGGAYQIRVRDLKGVDFKR
jgi:hypothetical protein